MPAGSSAGTRVKASKSETRDQSARAWKLVQLSDDGVLRIAGRDTRRRSARVADLSAVEDIDELSPDRERIPLLEAEGPAEVQILLAQPLVAMETSRLLNHFCVV